MTGEERSGRGGAPRAGEQPKETCLDGLLPLKALGGALELGRDAYYPRLMLLLCRAMEEACTEAAVQAMLDRPGMGCRQALSASARYGEQRAMLLSSMGMGQAGDGEACMMWFALSLEAGCAMAQRMEDNPARRAVHFLLPEYLDALYRLANLHDLQTGRSPQEFLCQYPEIMPGRPLAACQRPPWDGVSGPWQEAGLWDEMALIALSAVARQAGSACRCMAIRAKESLARELGREIALICRQHDIQYLSLVPRRTPLDRLRTAQYLTAFLYDSCALDETLPGPLRAFAMGEEKHALARLQRTSALLSQADPAVRALPPFPEPLRLRPCKGYVRDALSGVGETMRGDRIVPGASADPAALRYRRLLCPREEALPSHRVIRRVIAENGRDYRFEIARHPVENLRDRSRAPGGLSPEQ